MDMQGFYQGQILDAYEYLGAHYTPEETVFRTFAPSAQKISVLLADKEVPMNRVYDGNYYEVAIPDVKVGDTYEYRIYTSGDRYVDHSDPYGFQMELRPNHKSIVTDLTTYHFNDEEWMKKRGVDYDGPMNVYEMHVGSWRKPDSGGWFHYNELAPMLIPYLKENGFNYIEFLPISEHPSDESWGYQNTGFFAPTSRYGTPNELRQLIDELHQNDIGVFLDFVAVHFAIDDYGLGQYDGTALYEYPNNDVGHSEWGSYNFMHSRGEVRSFLQSSANYWLKEFHFDGLRLDAVSRIIYWQGDERRGMNGNAVDFVKTMNQGLKKENPGCILIAEDSTSFQGITKPVSEGGLGFDYKWDLGWMHDTLEYFQTAPELRHDHYHKLTFSMLYFWNERYMLPYSHDEVVHGKATILQKMNGQYEMKFPQGRAMYMYMMVHPGKKLNFMGNEIGMLREWDEKREQDWDLLKYPAHDSFHHYIEKLNEIYQTHSAMYEWDYLLKGFQWLDCDEAPICVYAMERRSEDDRVVAVFNFGPDPQPNYTVKLPEATSITTLLYSDWQPYGGQTPVDATVCELKDGELICNLQPLSGVLLSVASTKDFDPTKSYEQAQKRDPELS